MKNISVFLCMAFLLFSFLQMNCKKEPTSVPPDELQKEIILTLQDTTCTEAWLQLSFKNYSLPHSYKIFRDSNLAFSGLLFGNDTTLIDTTLLPKRNYHYKAIQFENGSAKDSSKIFQVTTMDTTSHEIIWETTLIGDGGSSIFNDVTIINDTLIYTVGEIYLNDSTGQLNAKRYNVTVWNGNHWKTERLPYYYDGESFVHPLKTIFALNSNNIWFGGNGLIYWNGKNYIEQEAIMTAWGAYSMNKVYASLIENIFVVGDNGAIAHFGGISWKKYLSGTAANINDIWGSVAQNGEPYILAAASTVNTFGEKKILRIKGESIDSLQWSPRAELHSIWFASERKIFTAGDGVYIGIGGNWKRVKELPSYYSRRIRGTAKNDVWVVGDFGLCAHFNGMTWKSYPKVKIDGIYHSVAVTNNEVIAVGEAGIHGIIVRGKRK